MTDPRSERDLVEAVLSLGDEAAFRLLYRRHTPRLFRIAARTTRDRGGLAEDLVQDTWLAAVPRLATFRWEASLGTWLTGILLHRIRSLIRSADWSRVDADHQSPETAGTPTSLDLRIDLDQALEALSPGYRAVVVLHDIEGFTHEEIGGMLGIDPGTSKSQLFRARRRLRARLAPGAASP